MSTKLRNLFKSGLVAWFLTAFVDQVWNSAEKMQFGELQKGRYCDDIVNFLFLGLLWQAWYLVFDRDRKQDQK